MLVGPQVAKFNSFDQQKSFDNQIVQNVDFNDIYSKKQLDFEENSILLKSMNKIEHINLHRFVNDIIFKFKGAVRNRPVKFINNIDLEIEFKSNSKNISIILANLFENSLYHGFSGNDEGIIKIEACIAENKLSVNYFDTGKGVKENELVSILKDLEMYQSESDSGLKIVNQIVLNMQGRLNITNNIVETGMRVDFEILVVES